MSNEETKEIEQKKFECNCEFCKAVKSVLAIALGTFIGFYCAMSLFFALHKPPMMRHGHFYKKHPQRFEQNFEHRRNFDGENFKPRGERPFKPGEIPAKPQGN